MIEELMVGWPVGLQLAVSEYVQDHQLEPAKLLRVDLVLVLLRVGHPEALQRVAELTGKAITACPSGMPPWPPKPPARSPGSPAAKIIHVVENPCPPQTDMHRRFGLVKKGLTREQLIGRGVQSRDIRYWQAKGHIKFSESVGQ